MVSASCQIGADLALLLPRQADQRLDVVAHHGGLGRHGRHQPQLLQLGFGLLPRFLGHVRGLDALVHLVQVGALFHVAELFLDRLDLLVQVVLALALLHLLLDAPADALLDLQDVELGFHQREQMLEALAHVEHLEHLLLLLQLERQVRGDGVGEPAGLVDPGQRGQDLGRDLLVELHVLVELGDHRAAHGLQLRAFLGFGRDGPRLCRVVGPEVGDRIDTRPLDPLHQHLHGAVWQLQHLQDVGYGAGDVHVLRRRLVLGGRLLRHQQDALASLHRRLQRLDRLRAPDEQRDHHVRKDHHVPQRKQREG